MTQSRKQSRADHCSIWSKRIYTKSYTLSAEEPFEGMFNAHGQDRKEEKRRSNPRGFEEARNARICSAERVSKNFRTSWPLFQPDHYDQTFQSEEHVVIVVPKCKCKLEV